MKNNKKFIGVVLAGIIFYGSIISMLVIALLGIHDNNHYERIEGEYFKPIRISTIMYHEEYEQLYVCYEYASYVNVYNSNGDFIWAVSTPYMDDGVYFKLLHDQLIIYGMHGERQDAYIYSAENGSFIERKDAKELTLEFEFDRDKEVGEYVHNGYQVYRTNEIRNKEVFVNRPEWYLIFTSGIILILGLIVGFYFVLSIIKRYKK